jgi:hypothetical protein
LSLFDFANDPATALTLLQKCIASVAAKEPPAFAHSRRPPT